MTSPPPAKLKPGNQLPLLIAAASTSTVPEVTLPVGTLPATTSTLAERLPPTTDWLPMKEFAPSVAKGEQVNGSAVSALPPAQVLLAMLNVPVRVIGPP